jgi:hypothetical protein
LGYLKNTHEVSLDGGSARHKFSIIIWQRGIRQATTDKQVYFSPTSETSVNYESTWCGNQKSVIFYCKDMMRKKG